MRHDLFDLEIKAALALTCTKRSRHVRLEMFMPSMKYQHIQMSKCAQQRWLAARGGKPGSLAKGLELRSTILKAVEHKVPLLVAILRDSCQLNQSSPIANQSQRTGS